MAEGGEFGYDDPDLDYDIDNDDDDDDDEDETTDETIPLIPGDSSTPWPQGQEIEMQTMSHEKSGLPDKSYIEETSFGGTSRRHITDDEIERRLKALRNDHTDLYSSDKAENNYEILTQEGKDKEAKQLINIVQNVEIERAKELIKERYPEANIPKLGLRLATAEEAKTKPGIKFMDIVAIGKNAGLIKVFLSNGEDFQSSFFKTEYIKKVLGRKALEIDNENLIETKKQSDELEKQMKEKQKELKQKESMAKESEKLKQQMEEKRNKIRQIEQQKDDLEDTNEPLNIEEIEKLKQQKKDLEKDHQELAKKLDQTRKAAKDGKKLQEDIRKLTQKNAELKETEEKLQEKINTEDLNEKKERKAELENKNKEDKAIIDDENASPSEKEAARERIADRQEEIGRLATQIEEKERAMPLRERVKEIFKKYGVTVTSILLAAGVTIGAVIGVITNALKSMAKALGNGLKAIAKKTASILPGLLGSIVSFLFATAGKVLGFLAEHTWLLILAVVAFLVESYAKKQS